MASNSIERMLELNNKIEKGNVSATKPTSGHKVTNQRDLDKLIESFDQQVYGTSAEPIMMNENKKKYDPRAEMEHLKEIVENGGRGSVNLEGRNIPRSIPNTSTIKDEMAVIYNVSPTGFTSSFHISGLKDAWMTSHKVESSKLIFLLLPSARCSGTPQKPWQKVHRFYSVDY